MSGKLTSLLASQDMTQGSPSGNLIRFSVPLLIGNLAQQLYSTVDSIVVGYYVGDNALAAVGASGPILNLLLVLFMGISVGASVMVSQYFGARDRERLEETVGTTITATVVSSIFIMVVGPLITPPVMSALSTPPEIYDMACTYLVILFAGIIGSAFYNILSGVLRGLGDSVMPVIFLIIACLLNIVLDVWFVAGFHWDVAGVAIATICSQLLSAVLVVISLMRSEMTPYQLFPKRLRIYAMPMRSILMIGVPTALQSVMYNASNIVIQASINSFGTDAVAAWTAYGKMDIIFWMTITAMAQSITTFAGQNYGAGEYERLKKGVRVSVAMTACFTVLLSTAFFLLARPLLAIFSPDPDVLEVGVEMVRFLAPCYITYILIELLTGAIRGAGKSVAPMLISVFGVCGLRLLWLFTVVPAHHTLLAVEASYPITWAVTSVAILLYYRFGRWLHPPKKA